jgi:hypothetical protein
MVALPLDLAVRRLATWVLEVALSVGMYRTLDLVDQWSRYPSGGSRRQSWKVCGRGTVICRGRIDCCPGIDWRTC